MAALLSYSHSRQSARLDAEGHLVILDRQDVLLWDREMIRFADHKLIQAQRLGSIGRFQLEAAIQQVHCRRLVCGKTHWAAIVQLYNGLCDIAPTLGAAVARAAAVGQAGNYSDGLACLDLIPADAQANFQPAWATRAFLLNKLNQVELARAAYERAIELTTHSGTCQYLKSCRNALD